MRKVIKSIGYGLLFVGVGGAAIAMLSEPFFSKLYDRMGINTASWVDPMIDLFQHPYIHISLSGMIGFGIGVLTYRAAGKIDADKKDRMNSASNETRTLGGLLVFVADQIDNAISTRQDVSKLMPEIASKMKALENANFPNFPYDTTAAKEVEAKSAADYFRLVGTFMRDGHFTESLIAARSQIRAKQIRLARPKT